MSLDLVALAQHKPSALAARARRNLGRETESFVRVLPIRWRLVSLAALNVIVALILAALIWNGANTLNRSWETRRRPRRPTRLRVRRGAEGGRIRTLSNRSPTRP